MAEAEKTYIETRNGCRIERVVEEIPNAKPGAPIPTMSFRVLTATGRIVKDWLSSIEEARAIADQQPS